MISEVAWQVCMILSSRCTPDAAVDRVADGTGWGPAGSWLCWATD